MCSASLLRQGGLIRVQGLLLQPEGLWGRAVLLLAVLLTAVLV